MKITIVKIGGAVIEQPNELKAFIAIFSKIEGHKILVHGGGRSATEIMKKMDIPVELINGRRVTNAEALHYVSLTYSGLNKQIVTLLASMKSPAIGLCGADNNVIVAKKRSPEPIDFGFVGDPTVSGVNHQFILSLLQQNIIPVFAPLTYDGQSSLLNTNADTIASILAQSLQNHAEVSLIYVFEKLGLLSDINDEQSVIPSINQGDYEQMQATGQIHSGMIPKLDNAFAAKQSGVQSVQICHQNHLLQGQIKTEIV